MTLTESTARTIETIAPFALIGRLAEVTDDGVGAVRRVDLRADGNPYFAAEEDAPVEPLAAAAARDGHRAGLPSTTSTCGGYGPTIRNGTRSCKRSPPTRRSCSATRGSGSGSARTYLPDGGRGPLRQPPTIAADLVGGLQHRRRSFHRRLLHCRLPAQPGAVADPDPRHRHWHRSGRAGQDRAVRRAGNEAGAGIVQEAYFRKAATANMWQAAPC